MFGNPEEISNDAIEAATDGRGVVAPNIAREVRRLRAQEPWERYDSIVIGEGARERSRGWFDNWQQLANADSITFFSSRDSSVGFSYCNQRSERTDWAQDIHQTNIEFYMPPGLSDIEADNNDAVIMPQLFVQQLAQQMAFRVILAESDEIALAPGNHFPAGYGTSGVAYSATAAPSVFPGSVGTAHVTNCWSWADPILLAAKAKLTVSARIDSPMSELLRNMPGPGAKLIPRPGLDPLRYPNWYVIKVTMRGPRYLQLRGARSSA